VWINREKLKNGLKDLLLKSGTTSGWFQPRAPQNFCRAVWCTSTIS